MKKPGNLNRDDKTGKFLPTKSTEEIIASIGELDDVINLKRELRDMRTIFVKNLRNTLTAPRIDEAGLLIRNDDGTVKQFPYELSANKTQALIKYMEILMSKLVANAKTEDLDTKRVVDVVIKPPKPLEDKHGKD